MTNGYTDIKNTDMMLIMGGNPAENHPCGFKWAIEAKRTRKDPRIGRRQAELYADCLEKQFGRRPVVFYTNGYQTYLWDDLNYPPRQVQGFYTKEELRLLIQRRVSRVALAGLWPVIRSVSSLQTLAFSLPCESATAA